VFANFDPKKYRKHIIAEDEEEEEFPRGSMRIEATS
jgi:hypothetical protein